jgi:tetratricopeptide (TPR) repeat protein
MAREVIAQSSPIVLGNYMPVDETAFPEHISAGRRQSAKIVNVEIRRTTYKIKDRIKQFAKAIQCDPENALAWYNRGQAYLESQDYSHAKQDFEQAVLLGYIQAYNAIGVIHAQTGKYDLALQDFDIILVKYPDVADPAIVAKAIYNKGVIFHERGDHEQALLHYQDVWARFYDSTETRISAEPQIREFLARALLNTGAIFHERAGSHKHGRDKQAAIVYDEVWAHFRNETEPRIRQVVAQALYSKALLLSWHGGNALAAYGDLLAHFGDTREPDIHAMIVETLCKFRDEIWRSLETGRPDDTRIYFTIAQQANFDAIREITKLIEKRIARYYRASSEEDNPSNGYDLPKRVITEAELRKHISEQAALLKERLSQPEDPPFPILDDRTVKAIITHGKKNPWDDRKERGWSYHTNAFVYVLITYRKWVNRGLTREIIAWADPALHAHLKTKITREGGLPGWLDLPSGPEARIRAITNPEDRAELETFRKIQRQIQRRHVARKAAGD